jgi:hypothetical protein
LIDKDELDFHGEALASRISRSKKQSKGITEKTRNDLNHHERKFQKGVGGILSNVTEVCGKLTSSPYAFFNVTL